MEDIKMSETIAYAESVLDSLYEQLGRVVYHMYNENDNPNLAKTRDRFKRQIVIYENFLSTSEMILEDIDAAIGVEGETKWREKYVQTV